MVVLWKALFDVQVLLSDERIYVGLNGKHFPISFSASRSGFLLVNFLIGNAGGILNAVVTSPLGISGHR
jgi:hypothetical protein